MYVRIIEFVYIEISLGLAREKEGAFMSKFVFLLYLRGCDLQGLVLFVIKYLMDKNHTYLINSVSCLNEHNHHVDT